MKKYIYILLIFLFCNQAFSQQYNSRGREFWLGFMDNYQEIGDEAVELSIFISSTAATTGLVEVPLMRWSKQFVTLPNKTIEIKVPKEVGLITTNDQIDIKGIHITANDPVTVYTLNYIAMTSDAAIILPVQTVGKNYVVQCESELFNSQFLVVANGDNTRVEIIPSRTTLGNNQAGKPYNITLNKGQVYQVKSKDKEDLTGSRVRVTDMTNSVSVFGGAYCTRVGRCGCCCNHLYEQMFPVIKDRMKEYITAPYRTRFGDIFRILATEDSTVVTINNRGVHKLNAYQYYDTLLTQASYIKSNRTISIAQLSRSRDCDIISNADPFMIILSSIEMTLDVITFNAFQTSIINNNYYVNVITASNNIDSVKLDGNYIGNQFSNVTANQQFSYARVPISEGDHTISAPGGLIAYVYGYGFHEAFGYSAGINVVSDFMNTSCPPDTVQTGDTISFPINFDRNNAILTIGSHKYKAVFKFNPNVLVPILDSTMTYHNDGILIINATAQDLQLPATLKEVKFKTMLGDSDCTTIYFDSLSWDNEIFPFKTNCHICLATCNAGGKRLILSNQVPYLYQNSPNPASDYTKINFVITEESNVQLFISDILGNKVKSIINDNLIAGKYSEAINVQDLSAGTYFYVLQIPRQSFVKKINIFR